MTHRAFFSWSGGKDSMLALHRALAAGWRVEALLAMFDESGERSRSHAHPAGADARAGRRRWAFRWSSAAPAGPTTRPCSREQLRAFAAQGLTHGLFGDIDLQPHRDWEEKVCAAAGLQRRAAAVAGSRAARWSTNCSRSATGRAWSASMRASSTPASAAASSTRRFLADLPEGVDACGENGEFHTFVFDGPRFARPVAHELVGVHEIRQTAPAPGHHFVAELR